MIAQPRHHGCQHRAHRHTRGTQPPDHFQATLGCCGSGFHLAAKSPVQRRDRDPDTQQPLRRRHRCQKIQIALDQGPLGGDRHRMTVRPQNFQHFAHHAVFGLAGLIGVGIRPQRNPRHPIAATAQFPVQHRPDPRPCNQPCLEIQTRRQVQKWHDWDTRNNRRIRVRSRSMG